MSNENFRTGAAVRSTQGHQDHQEEGPKDEASTARMAKTAIESAQRVGSEAASTITGEVKALLDEKVGDGADYVGYLANSVHSAAEDLDQNSPQLASLVRGVADRLDGYATDLRDQTVDQLLQAVSTYTRRQPALVFGLSALVGFFALRTVKSIPPSSPSSDKVRTSQAGGLYGT